MTKHLFGVFTCGVVVASLLGNGICILTAFLGSLVCLFFGWYIGWIAKKYEHYATEFTRDLGELTEQELLEALRELSTLLMTQKLK